MQLQCGRLEGEVTALQTQLKSSRQQIRLLQQKGKQLPEMKSKLESERLALEGEISQLKEMLENTRAQLKSEREARHKELIAAKQGISPHSGVGL